MKTDTSVDPPPLEVPRQLIELVGTTTWTGEGEVRARDFQRWALAVGETNRLYFDLDAAHAAGYDALVMPPMFLPMVVRPLKALADLREDGSVPEYDLPGLPARRMAGGDRSTYARVVLDGEHLTASRVLSDVVAKRGRSGDFLLATWTTTYRAGAGEQVAETTFSLVAR